MWTCSKGHNNLDTAKFCMECGEEKKTAPAPAATTAGPDITALQAKVDRLESQIGQLKQELSRDFAALLAEAMRNEKSERESDVQAIMNRITAHSGDPGHQVPADEKKAPEAKKGLLDSFNSWLDGKA